MRQTRRKGDIVQTSSVSDTENLQRVLPKGQKLLCLSYLKEHRDAIKIE